MSYLQDLVQGALREFDEVDLAVSVRRAWHVAQLLGDATYTWMFSHDSKPIGGSRTISIVQTQALWPDEDWETVRVRHSGLLEEFIAERKPHSVSEALSGEWGEQGEGKMLGGSVAEIEARHTELRQHLTECDPTANPVIAATLRERMAIDVEVLDRIRHRTFWYLCHAERLVLFQGAVRPIFDSHQSRVDRTLAEVAPDILDQFNAAYRRAREGDAESRSQCLMSCRRILRAVADRVYPPRDSALVDDKGVSHEMGPEQYVNRLWQFMVDATGRSIAARVSHAAIEDFGPRIDRLNELASKGVHDQVSESEVDLCVIQTYLFAGEVLRLSQESATTA
jgi:hypothetical protein